MIAKCRGLIHFLVPASGRIISSQLVKLSNQMETIKKLIQFEIFKTGWTNHENETRPTSAGNECEIIFNHRTLVAFIERHQPKKSRKTATSIRRKIRNPERDLSALRKSLLLCTVQLATFLLVLLLLLLKILDPKNSIEMQVEKIGNN